MAKNIWVVTWGTANMEGTDGEENASAFCGCVGVFTDKANAQKNMTTYKNTFIAELTEDLDEDDATREEIEETLEVYGSENDEYYEIDYNIFGKSYEVYIRLEEMNLNA